MEDPEEFKEVVIGLCEEAIDNQAKQINAIEEKLKVRQVTSYAIFLA